MLTLALIIALLAVCFARSGRPTVQIAAPAGQTGWRTVGPAGRAITVFALRLLVEACNVVVQTVVLIAHIVSLTAQWVEGTREEAA